MDSSHRTEVVSTVTRNKNIASQVVYFSRRMVLLHPARLFCVLRLVAWVRIQKTAS